MKTDMGIKRLFQNKPYIAALLFCVAGIALNLALNAAVTALDLPLYLDTVGTITVAAVGGYLPGVIVGFVTNIIKSISDPSSLYYGAVNVLIAIFAARLAWRGWFKNSFGIAGLIVVFTLIGGGLGALIPWFMEEITFESESLSGMLLESGFFGRSAAHFISSILMDLPDKVISVLLSLLLLRLIPVKFHRLFAIRGWMQKPIAEEDEVKTGSAHVRFLSLRDKLMIALGVSLVTVALAVMVISMRVFHKSIIREHTRIAQGTAEIAASVIDGDRVDAYLERGYSVKGYWETEEKLRKILQSATDIAYVYAYKIEEDGCHVVFDIDTEDVQGEQVGTVIPFDASFSDNIDELLQGRPIDPVITDDKYGYLLTAYQPVYDGKHRCVCYVGADVDMSQLLSMERSYLMEMISVFLGFFILLVIFVIWLIQYHIVYPVNTISECLNEFSQEEDSQEVLDEDVKKIRSLEIHTGDEIEKLYKSVCDMTLRQTEQMRNIRYLSESTARMQDGLIITMADMVENRDSDTGAHVQKTAAYVRILVEGLKKKGYYPEKITPKFISDVVRSAPLHDVGKINIPDYVLNKPGKLSEKEFEIMKTHTTAGKKIIEDAISIVEGENYLKEARNMAAYHHERWDGKGYPDGLHGEVIPLSARIMAVADVFDALSSERIYKPAFPFEKAVEIIEEGKGTQFDPKIIEVFMESLGEVRSVLRKYNKGEKYD